MEGHDIDRINVHRVLRIHNKFLRNRFDEKVESYLDMTNPSYRKNFEYLFIGVDPERPEDFNYFMEKGFRSPNEGDSLGLGSFPVLFNTINGAEGPRINSLRGKSGKEGDSMEEEGRKEQRIPTASILVCKVVMIKPNQDTENPTFSIGSEMKKIYSSIESAKKAALKTPESNSTFREAVPKKGKLDHRVYFVHDYTLIIPEYLIYLDYESDKMDMQTTYLGDSLVKLPNKDASFFRLNDDKNPESNLDFLFRSKLEKVKAKYTDPKFKSRVIT